MERNKIGLARLIEASELCKEIPEETKGLAMKIEGVREMLK